MSSFVWSLPVLRLVATDRCRVAAPWFSFTYSTDGTSRLRRLALALERNRLRGVTELEQALASIAFFPVSFVAALRALATWGGSLKAEYGVPRRRQLVDLLNYSWRLGMSPRTYYQFRLHRHSWRQSGRHFIDQPELHHLQRHISPDDINALEDKARFTAHARTHGLPLVPILAYWRDGQAEEGDSVDDGEGLPRRSIFVKPAASYSSAGVMGYRYDPTSDTYDGDARRWSRSDLRAHLAAKSKGRTLLVQPWMENAVGLHGFSVEALCNFRIVTARRPDGSIEPMMAALRFPWKSRVSCAEPGLTLCASVDMVTGVLRAAEARDPAIGRLVRHPVTGQQIEGFKVEAWSALLNAALLAHKAWPNFPFIGWDVVHTSEGIYILEGSCIWGGHLAQISGSAPLGRTHFPDIYLAHLEARQPVTP
jgi:hypothetical protein